MQFLISAVIFFAVIVLLVVVHEFGHYIVARMSGVVAQEFAIGFGPKLWSFTWRGTEFSLRAIPLGGFVKMLGDQDASSFKRIKAKEYDEGDKKFALKLLKDNDLDPKTSEYIDIENFVADQEEKLSEDEYKQLLNYFFKDFIPNHPGNYDNARMRSKATIMVAGVIMNFVLAAFIFYVMFPFTNYRVDLVKLGNPVFIGAELSSPPVLFESYGQSDSDGALIIDADGTRFVTESEFEAIVEANENQQTDLLIFTPNGYQEESIVLTGDSYNSNFDLQGRVFISAVTEDGPADEAGIESGSILIELADQEIESIEQLLETLEENKGETVDAVIVNDDGVEQVVSVALANPEGEEDPILGAGLIENDGYLRNLYRVDYSNNKFLSGFAHATNMLVYSASGLGELVLQSFQTGSVAPVSQGVSSIIGVADIINSFVGINDFVGIINLTGMVSIALAFVNILPIPLLDGGNLMFLVIEKLRGRPISDETQERIASTTFFLLIVLSILIMVKDLFQFNIISRILGLFGL